MALRAAEKNGFWESNNKDVEHRIGRICNVLKEIDIPVRLSAGISIFSLSKRPSAKSGLLVRRTPRRLLPLR